MENMRAFPSVCLWWLKPKLLLCLISSVNLQGMPIAVALGEAQLAALRLVETVLGSDSVYLRPFQRTFAFLFLCCSQEHWLCKVRTCSSICTGQVGDETLCFSFFLSEQHP